MHSKVWQVAIMVKTGHFLIFQITKNHCTIEVKEMAMRPPVKPEFQYKAHFLVLLGNKAER